MEGIALTGIVQFTDLHEKTRFTAKEVRLSVLGRFVEELRVENILGKTGSLFLGAALLYCLAQTPGSFAQTDNVEVLQPQVADNNTESINLGIGQSLVVALPWPAVGVSISQPAVADVQILNPEQLLLIGKALGVTDLVVWGESNRVWHVKLRVIVDLAYVELELQRIFPDAELQIVQSQDILVVQGQLRRVEDVANLRNVLDAYELKYVDATSLAGVQQVMLKVRIAEVSREAIRALGINGFHAGTGFFGGITLGSDGGGPLNPLSIFPSGGSTTGNIPFTFGEGGVGGAITLFGGIPGSDLELFIQALAENQYVRILAEPTLMALSGEEASFLAGGEFPVPIVQGGNQAGTSITVQYKEFGVRLSFSPTVLGDGRIRLHLAPEVSELSQFGAVIIEGFEIPSILTRRAETTLELRTGQTFAIAGLFRMNAGARRTAVPLLGDLPIIGPLFRSIRYVRGETELVVLATATLVEPSSEAGDWPMPGDDHIEPDDWELYIDGRIEGRRAGGIAPQDADHLQQLSLHRLVGPGAWATFDQLPAPVLDRPISSNPPSMPGDESSEQDDQNRGASDASVSTP